MATMHVALVDLCSSLDSMSKFVLASWGDDRTAREALGWHHAALTRYDLAGMASNLADRIRLVSPDAVEPKLLVQLQGVPIKLQQLHTETIPYMFNGNGQYAIPAYMNTVVWVTMLVEPLLGWTELQSTQALPPQLAKRLRSFNATLDQIAPDKEKLEIQIAQIQDATAAAESLPTDLQALEEARKKVIDIGSYSDELRKLISDHERAARLSLSQISNSAKSASDHLAEVSKIVENCEEAYRITTTKGLAAAFDQRASRLGASMWVWVLGLLAALYIGAIIGSDRITILSRALSDNDLKWGVVVVHVLLSVLSIGGPLWFAWLATKQIGQRFRLAEDYGFKASVAKAYEGYRKEAARIDPAFESRLFNSALTRLEEAPLRLVEQASHGSPWHELLNSDAIRNAAQNIPDFRNDVVNLANKALGTLKPSQVGEVKAATLVQTSQDAA